MKRLLVIEDEPALRDNLVTLLRLEGYDVAAAADGAAGLEEAARQPPDLVLCDIQMPGLDGHAVLARLRADARLAGISFIFITARTSLADLRAGMNLGADDYLPKPFTSEELLAAVDARLCRAEIAARARGIVPEPARLTALGLTLREAEVLHWVAQGKSNPEIALILNMGPATVKTHLLHIFDKLGVESRGAAALRALEMPAGGV